MSLLKQLKWNLILLAVIFIALGIVLILWPGATMKTICYLLAAMLLAIGVVSLINYLRKDISGIIYRYEGRKIPGWRKSTAGEDRYGFT